MRKSKKALSVGIILIAMLCITACVKTPEEKVVVDKSEGIAKENILPKETKKKPKELGVPEHWQETMERSDRFAVLEADCDIEIPEVYNTPVYSYEMKPLTDERLEELCTYFAEGDRLYEDPPLTKEELSIHRDKMAGQKGTWESYGDPIAVSLLNNSIAKIDNMIEKAPDEKPEHTYIEAGFTVPQKMQVENVRSWNYVKGWFSWYHDTEEEIGFTARVDKGRACDPVIRAVNYNDKVGSAAGFVFSQGTFVDERELNLEWSIQKIYGESGVNYLTYLSDKMEQMEDAEFTQEDALAEVDKILGDLSIEDVEVTDCVKAVGTSDSESWCGLDEDSLLQSTGYAVYLAPKAGDVAGYSFTAASSAYKDLPETTYAPSFLTEQIRMIVTREGLQRFEWINISRRKDTIAENTKLLTFDVIKEKLADHLLYISTDSSGGGKPEGIEMLFTVKNVMLRAANINAYEDPKAVWLVPVWVFELEQTMKYEKADQTEINELGPKVVVLNAIDGGFVAAHLNE